VDGDVLQVTKTLGSQTGKAFLEVDVDVAQAINVKFDMYVGDGSGADGLCATLGGNSLGNRVAENGVTEGISFCFDEWSNGNAESGIKIFYNPGSASGGDGHGCGDSSGDVSPHLLSGRHLALTWESITFV
jgi:hypothetical protein